ncbi:MAG: nucleotidyltransferase domain-containing protein [Campylobacterota bacterium]|nr:nucleotidyltransferase domain-containing protein [Campylobacterota bacterium]
MIEDILKNKLASSDNVVFGYLFGSYATQTQTQKSDIDIALWLKDTSLDAQLQINYELSKLLKKDVDLVLLNSIKNIYLLESILKEGKVLKDSDERFDFELLKEHQILDYKAFKKYIDAA